MSDAVVKIGALVDTEALQSGMAASADAVRAATSNMGVSFQEVQSRSTAAWKKISDDTKAAAYNVNSESLKIAESTKAVAAAQQELRAALALTRNANVEASSSTAILAAAQDNARAKALELKDAQEAVAHSAHEVVPEMAAASAATRSLAGAVPIRAVERFLSTTLGLAPVLAAAFPLVGAIDLGFILFKTIGDLVEIAQKAKGAGAAIDEAFGELHDKAILTNDDLRIQSDKLQDELDKLGGHPGNGLQIALDECIKRADQLLVSLHADAKEASEIFKQNSVGFVGDLLTNVTNTGKQVKELKADNEKLVGAVQTANANYTKALLESKTPEAEKTAGEVHAAAIHAAFNAPIAAYKKEIARLDREIDVYGGKIDNSAKIANLRGVTAQLQDRENSFDLSEKVAGQQADVGQAKQDKEPKGAGENKAAEAQMKAMEMTMARMKADHDVSIEEEYAYWESMMAAASKYPQNLQRVTERVGELNQQMGREIDRSINQAVEAQKKKQKQDADDLALMERIDAEWAVQLQRQADDVSKTGERWADYNREVAKGKEIQASVTEAMEQGRLKALEADGGISALSAAQVQARIHADEHTRALKALQAELEALQAAAANLKPGDNGYEENQTKQQGVQNQIAQQQGSGQQQAQQDQAAVNAAVAKPYLSAFTSINNGWLKVQNDLIQGNKNIKRDFAEMGLHLVQSMAANFERMLVSQAMYEVRRITAHRVATMTNNATDAAGAATSEAINAKSNLKEIFSDAKTAAAKAYKAMAGIPIVGPELGAVAAAATFAGVMSLAAFEKGGIVAGSTGMMVPILAHGGERVLSTQQTSTFERMVNGAASGSTTHINFGGNHSYSGAGAGDFKGQLRQHRMELAKVVKGLRREGHI